MDVKPAEDLTVTAAPCPGDVVAWAAHQCSHPRNDPLMVRTAGCGNLLEVGVVVQHDETSRLRCRRGHQIRDRQAVLATASQLVLQLNGP